MFDVGPDGGAAPPAFAHLLQQPEPPPPSDDSERTGLVEVNGVESAVERAMRIASTLAERKDTVESIACLEAPISELLAADRERARRALEKNLEIVARKSGLTFEADDEPVRKETKRTFRPSTKGLGAAGAAKVIQLPADRGQENTSCYVSGLQQNATEQSLEELFQPFGRIVKVKIYRDAFDQPKGDALVTFAKLGSAKSAVAKLDGQDDMSVSLATFHSDAALRGQGPLVKPTDDDDWPQVVEPPPPPPPPVEEDEEDPSGLPLRCQGRVKPVVLLRHLYDAAQCRLRPGRSFLDELEAEIRQECSKFGQVLDAHAPHNFTGSVAVTFDTVKAAEHCAVNMDGRWFDNVQILVERLGNWEPPDVVLSNTPHPYLSPDVAPPSAAVAIVRNAYTDDELRQGGQAFLTGLQAEFRSECDKYGDVLNLSLPAERLPGSIVVAFAHNDAFLRCQQDMDGRWFDYRRLKVERYQEPPPREDPPTEASLLHAIPPVPTSTTSEVPPVTTEAVPQTISPPVVDTRTQPDVDPDLEAFFQDVRRVQTTEC